MSEQKELSFWDHLSELRDVALRILILLLILSTGFFFIMPWFFDHVIMAPTSGTFPVYRLFDWLRGDGSILPDLSSQDFHVQLINIELASQFFIHVSSSFWLAVVVAFPIIIYMIWVFVKPALYENEKRGARKAFLFGNFMFYLGMAVGYFVAFPVMLRFLADYHLSDSIANTVSLTSYMDSFYLMVMMMGLLFELPLLAWMLGKTGLLKRGFFSRYRRYAIVGLLIIAGVVTPTSDLVTLMIVFLPVYLLWEASALLVPKSDDNGEGYNDDTADPDTPDDASASSQS